MFNAWSFAPPLSRSVQAPLAAAHKPCASTGSAAIVQPSPTSEPIRLEGSTDCFSHYTMKGVFWTMWIGLVLVRLPSLVQPAGGDQGLYAYIGQRIVHGEIPYRDAWDQKPPAIHYTYALMYKAWPHDSVVAASDLIVAVAVAMLLCWLGRRLAPRTGAGETAALLYLLFSNPAFTRLGGVRTRSQCETFIALIVTAALVTLVRAIRRPLDPQPATGEHAGAGPAAIAMAGALLGLAALYKYNAVSYAIPAVSILAFGGTRRAVFGRRVSLLAAGFAAPVLVTAAFFAAQGGWNDLVQATVYYNIRYSGETYSGLTEFLRYLTTFPIRSARVDALWFLGGVGSLWLLATLVRARGHRDRLLIVATVWIAASCLSIAINGGRGLPQYFIQAQPPLALAAGLGLTLWWRDRRAIGRVVTVLLLVVAVFRINRFDNAIDRTWQDLRYAAGDLDRDAYLARFGGQRADDKFSALAVSRLGDYLKANTRPDDSVLVFGFSGGAYVRAERRSASRFFWSRPVIIGFNDGQPGYGAAGLLADLGANRPKIVVLQHRDWDPDIEDSATFFWRTQPLADWLQHRYRPAETWQNFEIWARQSTSP